MDLKYMMNLNMKKAPDMGAKQPSIRLFLAGFFKFLVELVDTAVGGNCSLFASVEWVAVGAGFNFDFFAHC